MMPSDFELQDVRRMVETLFVDRCDISRSAATDDDPETDPETDPYGEQLYDAPAAHLTDQPCLFWTDAGAGGGVVRGGEVQTPPRDYVGFAYRMAVPIGTDVQESDVVTAVRNQLGESRIVNPLNVTTIQHRDTELILSLEETR